MIIFRRLLLAVLVVAATIAGPDVQAAREIPCVSIDQAPVLDGSDQDPAWKEVAPVAIKDSASGSLILLRAAHTDDRIFFFVQFPDPAQNILHKPLIWDEKQQSYVEGPHREDTFVFKWNMEDQDVDLSNFSDDNYQADVWYWKANRTNPAGYADDKMQVLASEPGKKSKELIRKSGGKAYLSRISDAGTPAYRTHQPTAYEADVVNAFPEGMPDGSRGDVRAKGVWKDGLWFIEFARALKTGHDDDVQFDLAAGRSPLFGVSIFSLYGNPLDEKSPNLYGMGRISEPLYLKFE